MGEKTRLQTYEFSIQISPYLLASIHWPIV
jgi:hypothetical protein